MYETPSLLWDTDNLDFNAYLAWAKALLTARRCDISTDQALNYRIYHANMPFELKPDNVTTPKRGILLLHGLLSSPITMHDIGHYFQKKGFLVRGLLLPGHGTQPHDLRHITMHDWINAVTWGVISLKQEVDEIWLGGLSGGASLALCHAYEKADIHSLVLFAPSLLLKNRLVPLTPLLNKFCQITRFNYWPEKNIENDYAKYNSFSIEFAAQAYLLTQYLKKYLIQQPLNTKLWMALTEDDETICSQAALTLFESTQQPGNQLLWYAKKPLATSDPRIINRKSDYPEQRILDFSHACLTFSPLNTHYGHNGDFGSLLNHPHRYKGATHSANMKKFSMHRLLYNPDFNAMIEYLGLFIDKLEKKESIIPPSLPARDSDLYSPIDKNGDMTDARS